MPGWTGMPSWVGQQAQAQDPVRRATVNALRRPGGGGMIAGGGPAGPSGQMSAAAQYAPGLMSPAPPNQMGGLAGQAPMQGLGQAPMQPLMPGRAPMAGLGPMQPGGQVPGGAPPDPAQLQAMQQAMGRLMGPGGMGPGQPQGQYPQMPARPAPPQVNMQNLGMPQSAAGGMSLNMGQLGQGQQPGGGGVGAYM
jgi:hypothetical protein